MCPVMMRRRMRLPISLPPYPPSLTLVPPSLPPSLPQERTTLVWSFTRLPYFLEYCHISAILILYMYSRYFSGGKIFVVFVVERQATKFLRMKQYRIVWLSHTYCTVTTKSFLQTGQKFTAHKNFTPPPRKIPAIR